MWKKKLSLLVILVSVLFGENKESDKFTIIAHMANGVEAVKWAVEKGANGIEVDLNFKKTGELNYFKHGGICDCDCWQNSEHICQALLKKDNRKQVCNAKETLSNMRTVIAENSKKLALLYIDSKLDKSINLKVVGQNVVTYLDTVFQKGFKGQVIVSAPEKDYIEYLKSVVEKAKDSPYNKTIL